MIDLRFAVTYTDGSTVDAHPKPKDVVAFERQYGTSIAKLADEQRAEWLYYLAWSVLHRSGREPHAFDEFLDRVDSVTIEADEADADPSQPEA